MFRAAPGIVRCGFPERYWCCSFSHNVAGRPARNARVDTQSYLVVVLALSTAHMFAVEFDGYCFLKRLQLRMVVQIELGDKHLKIRKVSSKLLVALCQMIELGSGGSNGVRIIRFVIRKRDDHSGVDEGNVVVLEG